MLDKLCGSPAPAVEVAESSTPLLVSESTEETEGLGEDLAVFAQNELLERLGGRLEMVPRFVTLFCKGVLPQLEGLATALESDDADGARRHAHAIKGSAGNIAALRMQRTASAVEQAAKEGALAGLPQQLAILQQEYREFVVIATALGFMAEDK